MGLDRRRLLGVGAAGAWLLASPRPLLAQTRIPQRAGSRVIVDNDFAGDPDGLLALAHQLLAPRTVVPLVTVSGLDTSVDPAAPPRAPTIATGEAAASELCERLGLAGRPVIATGRELWAEPGEPSPAARAIVAEALRDDPLPLVFSCGGPLTYLADALRLAPAIAGRMRVIWIGGGGYPEGGWEYNLAADPEAARFVIEQTQVPLVQVPQPAYRLMLVSVAEMEADMLPISGFSRWLYARFTTVPEFVDLGGSWPMGDSPPVLFTAISEESSRLREMSARRINADLTYGDELGGRSIRVAEHVDMRLTWADFLARLRIHATGGVHG